MNTARKLPASMGGRRRGASLRPDEVDAVRRQAAALMRALTAAMDTWDASIARAAGLHKAVAAEVRDHGGTEQLVHLVSELGTAIAGAAAGGAAADKALRSWVEMVSGPIEAPAPGARAADAGAGQ